ncbi:MAG TPA: alpha/beta hydrolase [Mycobacteriales bacterium]|jgi:pimeloyl-ACP methyl ester carboxylesterase
MTEPDVTLVLLHAFPLSSAMWGAQRDALADVCRVITPDQRGFGGTPLGDDAPSLERAADDVVALLDRLGLDRVVLGGLSMGGYVTMRVLARYPERVRGLVLADTKATADPAEVRERREQVARRAAEPGGMGALATEQLPVMLGRSTLERRPDVVEAVRSQLAAAPAESVAWASRAMAARPDSLDVLAAADVPALVLVGEEDTLTGVPDAEAMAAALPRGRLVHIPAAGHLSALENPGPFGAAVREFVVALP